MASKAVPDLQGWSRTSAGRRAAIDSTTAACTLVLTAKSPGRKFVLEYGGILL